MIILEFCARPRVENARTTRNHGYRSNLPYFFIGYRLHVRKCTDAIAVGHERRFVALWSAAKSFPTAPTAPTTRAVDLHARQMYSTHFRTIVEQFFDKNAIFR